MATAEPRAPVQPGEMAPGFTLPAADRDGMVALADYRGKSPVLLAFERGFWCAFCRRHINQFSTMRDKLQALGVETLVILATEPERSRLYLKYHPIRLPLAADPAMASHHAFGLHTMAMTPVTIFKMLTTRSNPTGELEKPASMMKLASILDRMDNFEPTDVDKADARRQRTQLVGQFLVDRDGIVRWANIEGAREGIAGIGKLPSEEEFLAAARALSG